MIIYEQPLNELARILLKLEYLFQKGQYYHAQQEAWDVHTRISALCDILTLLDRPDLRSKLSKEVLRYVHVFNRLRDSNGTNQDKLLHLLTHLKQIEAFLIKGKGRLAQDLGEDEFLKSIRQHIQSPGGTCGFELPLYHYWQQQPISFRDPMITQWFSQLDEIKNLSQTLLNLIRQSGHYRTLIAKQGFYQMPLDSGLPCQLIQIRLSHDLPHIPTISAGKHQLSIYFMGVDFVKRPAQQYQDISFDMALCVV